MEGTEKFDKLVLDFNPETKEELVSVDPFIVSKLKPHQVNLKMYFHEEGPQLCILLCFYFGE